MCHLHKKENPARNHATAIKGKRQLSDCQGAGKRGSLAGARLLPLPSALAAGDWGCCPHGATQVPWKTGSPASGEIPQGHGVFPVVPPTLRTSLSPMIHTSTFVPHGVSDHLLSGLCQGLAKANPFPNQPPHFVSLILLEATPRKHPSSSDLISLQPFPVLGTRVCGS